MPTSPKRIFSVVTKQGGCVWWGITSTSGKTDSFGVPDRWKWKGRIAGGYNQESVGIAYEGGLNENGLPADTRTSEQKHSLRVLIRTLKKMFPIRQVCGHRDLSPDRNGNGVVESSEWLKQCPCFDVATDQWCA